jgi:hypothetical protein
MGAELTDEVVAVQRTPFQIGDRVRSAYPEMMRDFRGTVEGFENVVVRAGDDVGTLAAGSFSGNGQTCDYYTEQRVIVRGDEGWVNAIHPTWLTKVEGA